VLFVAEEASSFLHVQLLELAFFACSSAFWITWVLNPGKESHVKFPTPPGPLCSDYNFYDALFFLFIAVSGGVIGAVFNSIVFKCNHFRMHNVNPFPLRRLLEVLLVVIATCSACVLLPYSWECRDLSPDLLMKDSVLSPREDESNRWS
jgi:H+/Cl- antiporter ClcA